MKLIAEQVLGNITKLNEARDSEGKKHLYVEGIFAQADLQNHNNRIYPKDVLKPAIDRYIEDYVKTKRALGEMNHPDEFNVNPERACILIERLTWDGNNVIGKAKVLSTPQGELVKRLLSDGVQLGVSTRGVGSIHEDANGVSIVESDYIISAIDVVSSPSAPQAFVNGILESADFVIKNGIVTEQEIDGIYNNYKNGRNVESDENLLINRINKFNNINNRWI